ncbi:MAG: sigma factor-like helix-turn-helix DNA-binding protein [Candidatus Latescibacteria bacterium]|nr:sigma factor-like helix-turn-helix DNA-binding protein [Candidatus Latescibacterota bacterium]
MLVSNRGGVPCWGRGSVILRELDWRSYHEIADMLSCPVGTVRSRLFRARSQIKGVLEMKYREGLLY